MNNRITKLFASGKRNVLSVYYTAGFPTLNDTVQIAVSLQAAGADIIEIGIPFSDPVADGPTIQASNKIALDNGMTVKLLLTQVKEIRKTVTLPIVLMGYLNPVMQYGFEKFVADASEAGVDGMILPDLPLYEYEEQYIDLFRKHNISLSFLVAPTTSEARIRKIDQASFGFVYAVSSSSTTGIKSGFDGDQLSYFQRLKDMNLKNPLLIGFGISTAETFQQASSFTHGAIVGSAFINKLKDVTDFDSVIKQFVTNIKANTI